MKIFGLGLPELLIILAVALLIFGPKALPKLGRSMGKAVKGLREGLGSKSGDTAEASTKIAETSEAAPAQPRKKKKPAAAKAAEAKPAEATEAEVASAAATAAAEAPKAEKEEA